MKATLEIPDELYRRVKAKSALEGRPLRLVAIELFEKWAAKKPATKSPRPGVRAEEVSVPEWVGSLRKYAKNARGKHDMESIRESMARGRAAEMLEKYQ